MIGFSVMNECESVSTAMSILLSKFEKLPRATYYDKGCNLAKSIILRLPWINNETAIMSDIFQSRSHKCILVAYPDSYPYSMDHRTSGAEVIISSGI